MAGGVALNCVANGRILREGPFEEIWIQPAAGDAGGALGAPCTSGTVLDRPRPHRAGQPARIAARAGILDEEITAYLDQVDAVSEKPPTWNWSTASPISWKTGR